MSSMRHDRDTNIMTFVCLVSLIYSAFYAVIAQTRSKRSKWKCESHPIVGVRRRASARQAMLLRLDTGTAQEFARLVIFGAISPIVLQATTKWQKSSWALRATAKLYVDCSYTSLHLSISASSAFDGRGMFSQYNSDIVCAQVLHEIRFQFTFWHSLHRPSSLQSSGELISFSFIKFLFQFSVHSPHVHVLRAQQDVLGRGADHLLCRRSPSPARRVRLCPLQADGWTRLCGLAQY